MKRPQITRTFRVETSESIRYRNWPRSLPGGGGGHDCIADCFASGVAISGANVCPSFQATYNDARESPSHFSYQLLTGLRHFSAVTFTDFLSGFRKIER
jgi:hypothetical protein